MHSSCTALMDESDRRRALALGGSVLCLPAVRGSQPAYGSQPAFVAASQPILTQVSVVTVQDGAGESGRDSGVCKADTATVASHTCTRGASASLLHRLLGRAARRPRRNRRCRSRNNSRSARQRR
jgi:hypothetical protein